MVEMRTKQLSYRVLHVPGGQIIPDESLHPQKFVNRVRMSTKEDILNSGNHIFIQNLLSRSEKGIKSLKRIFFPSLNITLQGFQVQI